jgi:hypothetical protein
MPEDKEDLVLDITPDADEGFSSDAGMVEYIDVAPIPPDSPDSAG